MNERQEKNRKKNRKEKHGDPNDTGCFLSHLSEGGERCGKPLQPPPQHRLRICRGRRCRQQSAKLLCHLTQSRPDTKNEQERKNRRRQTFARKMEVNAQIGDILVGNVLSSNAWCMHTSLSWTAPGQRHVDLLYPGLALLCPSLTSLTSSVDERRY